jgi:PKD repeat protein
LIIDSEGGDIGSGPIFASPLTASPTVGTVGEAATFTAVATGSDGVSLNYSWDFGDGIVGSGSSVAHIFSASGIYSVSVTVSDGVTNSFNKLDFIVSAENDVGTDNGGDTAWAIGSVNEFKVLKSSVKLNFADGSKDIVQLSGIIPVSKFFKPNGKTITVVIGELIQSFTLDEGAQGLNDAGTLKLSGKMKNGVFKATPAKFSIALKGGALESPFAKIGMDNSGAAGRHVSLPITLIIDHASFQINKDLLYNAVAGKKGATK